MAFVLATTAVGAGATQVAALTTPRSYFTMTKISSAAKTVPTTGQIWPRRGS